MSIYFSISSIIIGKAEDVRVLDAMITQSESESPSATFERKVLLEGEVCAFAYHAGRSRFRPQMQGLLAQMDHDVDTLDVCVYLLSDSEMGNVSTLCYQHGATLETSDDEIDNAAIEEFRKRCTDYGVDLRKACDLVAAIDGQVAIEPPGGWPRTINELDELAVV